MSIVQGSPHIHSATQEWAEKYIQDKLSLAQIQEIEQFYGQKLDILIAERAKKQRRMAWMVFSILASVPILVMGVVAWVLNFGLQPIFLGIVVVVAISDFVMIRLVYRLVEKNRGSVERVSRPSLDRIMAALVLKMKMKQARGIHSMGGPQTSL